MSYQDPPRRQRQSRYPALAQYEDSFESYPDDRSYRGYQSYQDTEADYRTRTGYAGDHRGLSGLGGGSRQPAPWDDPWEQPTEWEAPRRTAEAPRRTSGPFFAASDDYDDYADRAADDYPRRSHARAGGQRPGRPGGRGLLAGAVVGFLAAAVALGVANLIAAFVRPQASPIIAVGGAFIDRTPPALKNFAVQKFGENDKTMLLLGMYVTIALIAIGVGMLAWRRVGMGVAGIGLFGLFGAFVAITRPESHVTDVIPSVVGGIAGIAAIVWLVGAAARRPAYRPGWTA